MKKAWERIPLAELCEVFSDGDWIESKDQASDGIRLIQTGNVGEGTFKNRAEKSRYISEATFKRLRCTEIVEGDCLISRLPDPVGRSCILPDTGERMITAVDCTIVRFRPNHCLPEFFSLYSQSTEYLSAVAKACTGTTRSRISRSNLGLTPIPFPPFAEQQRIVGVLQEAFTGIATAQAHAENNLRNARALFESYLQSVFTLFDEKWIEKRLADACWKITDGTHHSPKTQYSGPAEGRFLYITSKNIRNNHMDLSDVSYIDRVLHDEIVSRCSPSHGDVLLTKDGANTGNVTLNSIHEPFSLLSSVCLIKTKPEVLIPAFLCYYLQSPAGFQSIVGQMTGAAIKRTVLKDIKEAVVPLPSTRKQVEIVETLDALLAETQRLGNLYQQKLAGLVALKKSLLHQAFSGEL